MTSKSTKKEYKALYESAKAESDECFTVTCELQAEVSEKDKKILKLKAKLQAEADESAEKILEFEANLNAEINKHLLVTQLLYSANKKILELEAKLQAEADSSAKKILDLEAKVKKYEDAEYAYNQKFKQRPRPIEAEYDSDDEPLLPFKHIGKRVK
jgi:hypothetical protein